LILHAPDGQRLINGDALQETPSAAANTHYTASIPAGLLWPNDLNVQAEGCRKADIRQSGGGDWIKEFRHCDRAERQGQAGDPGATGPGDAPVKLYFGIHKHMHQPYYNTTDRNYWDGEKDGIFGARGGPYTHFIPDRRAPVHRRRSASRRAFDQLERLADRATGPLRRDGLCGGRFGGWNNELRAVAQEKTALGHPRVDFSAFGFFHPLMALTPARNIVKQVEWHRGIIRTAFGIEASNVMFPPETAFHVRMIPALNQAGVKAVIYDSIHRFRACRDYPYAGINEGMLPPNPAEQVEPAGQRLAATAQHLGRFADFAEPAAPGICAVRRPGRPGSQDHRRAGRALHRQRGCARRFRGAAISRRAGPGLQPDRRHRHL
jgi:hypothetical protein